MVNTVLAYHLELARASGITVECKAIVPENIGIDEMELCTVLSNLLENATLHSGCTQRQLAVTILQNKEQLCIRIENSVDGAVNSVKPQGSGIGLKSVEAIVAKHMGVMNVLHTQARFTVDIAM